MQAGGFFVVAASDRPDALALRQQLRPAHRQWLRHHPGHAVQVLLGGPTLDAQQRMDGTVLVVQAASAEDVRRFVEADPYQQAGLFEHWSVRHWDWSLGRPDPAFDATAAKAPDAP